jgi:protein-disulfide isomerase
MIVRRALPLALATALLLLIRPTAAQGPQEPLQKQIDELRAQQAAMQKDLQDIKAVLQALIQNRGGSSLPEGASVVVDGAPSRGSASARVVVAEVSDYHCPFCRRYTQETMPQLMKDYVATGKVRYVFLDCPIAQLHPNAFRSHEAAQCAGQQGKYWEMHDKLFASPPQNDAAGLASVASAAGVPDADKFKACLSGGSEAAGINQSLRRMSEAGISGTPTFLIGVAPAPGAPLKVVRVVRGAKPYEEFKSAIDAMLASKS